jgi:hypothetical protein
MTIALSRTKLGAHWIQCADCKDWFDPYEDSVFTVHIHFDTKTICVNCAELLDLGYCADCEEIFERSALVTITSTMRGRGVFKHNDKTVCVDCAEEAGWHKCTACEDWTDPDDQYTSPGGDAYCNSCFFEEYGYCVSCEEVFGYEDLSSCNDEMYCRDCLPHTGSFDPQGFHNRSGCTTIIGSERCYGLELETDDCDDYNALEESGAWGAKNDPTCNGKEFYSTILDGDEGLVAIANLTEHADRNRWEVGDSCGYHLHIDMRGESDDSLFAAAYAYRITQAVWHGFVESHRLTNTYSHEPRWTCADLIGYRGHFEQFVSDNCNSRYSWINLVAWSYYTTFEIRLHHATLDEDEVCNWVKAHTRFVDWATTLGLANVRDKLNGMSPTEMFDFIAREVWRDEVLRDYYAAKAA